MKGSTRRLVFALGVVGLGVMLALALLRMPAFGDTQHSYRDAAVAAALARNTANVVSSVNFDLRGLDTLGEEAILLASVIGAAVLLRPGEREHRLRPPGGGRTLRATALAGYLLLPITLVLGADVVLHGQITPGGGFQGGVVLATGLHLLYVAGSYPALRRLRPLRWYEIGEAVGMGAVVALGITGLALGAGLLANVLPTGQLGQLVSSGTVPIFSVGVGIAVASGMVVLLAQFLEQDLAMRRDGTGRP
ncbi:MnhB domain-containing protein [Amycolatopsis taiwanensis]|uniref:Na+/H+ antiporter MnhB subunit-related protein domain-containing protein n=1 Tax=Amycolatopsis taiwanensis TaxID=342230 RepID=A0A9W6VL31_9PSEU|nr:MnhB domain-containing protein [Amycolatopsis taiwanensis]GLY70101.1 hypothetical protein Atai01_67200 [Amycolatopsis taiwanensis]